MILLFLSLSMAIIMGLFIIASPGGDSRQLAAISVDRPSITRVTPEESAPLDTSQPIENTQESNQGDTVQGSLPEAQRDSRLFFYKLDDQGQITLKSVLRPVQQDRYGLQTSIEELLTGPGSVDLDKGYLSLIPQGTLLNEVRILGNTARLDFSEEFCFNPLGYEGFNAQLKQIIYTATEFNQIDEVLITIDGELREYINGEGMYTGEPLSRESF